MATPDQPDKQQSKQELVDSIISGGGGEGAGRLKYRRRKPGAFSDPMRFSQLDRRTREFKAMEQVAGMLVDHFHGEPSFPQQLLIQSTCRIWLQLELLHGRLMETPGDRNIEHLNSLTRTLRANLESLGLQPPATPTASLADYLATVEAQA
ncbi:MAG: hypothetical protein AAFQ22_00525 [Pseudomonadota bacterium]